MLLRSCIFLFNPPEDVVKYFFSNRLLNQSAWRMIDEFMVKGGQGMMLGRNLGICAMRSLSWVLIYAMFALPFENGLFDEPAALAASSAPSEVQKGIDLYEQNKLVQARDILESAAQKYPENISVPYYLGLICLKLEQRQAAIDHWQKYISMAPQDETSLAINKNITLLLRKEAREYAQKALAQEAEALNQPVEDNAVAVSGFKNLGSQDLAPLSKGMAAMIIADLSSFQDLKVVEREKLQALLAEMKIGSSGLVDQKNAPKVGKLLRAKYVTSGSLTDMDHEKLQLAAAVFNAEEVALVGDQQAGGKLSKFYEVEKELACQIVRQLGRVCANAPQAFSKIHTKSLPAMVAYSEGLDYLDDDQYDEARIMFQRALDEDPNFGLAQAALLATPAAAMLLMTESQMISSAAAAAPSPAATAVGSTAAVSTGTVSAGGGLGLGTTAAIAGGVVVAGGVTAAAVGSLKEEEKSSPDQQQKAVSFDGQWEGNWSDQTGQTGSLRMDLRQNGTVLNGTVTFFDCDCLDEATVSGSADDNRINLEISSPDVSATLNANADSDAGSLTGTLNITSGACNGSALDIATTRGTGSGRVGW